MRLNVMRLLCERVARQLPARDIKHNGRHYLRRYYVGTILGVRIYLHHFVDSDPADLHNHPWRFGGSLVLAGFYYEERRFCRMPFARRVSLLNIVNGDTLHRVVVPNSLGATSNVNGMLRENVVCLPELGVWTLFWHTKKVMAWATIKDKGVFKQYYEEQPTHEVKEGHSRWYETAKKGKEVFALDDLLKDTKRSRWHWMD